MEDNFNPFETHEIEEAVVHFVNSQEKPKNCSKIVSTSHKKFITCSECKYVAENSSRFEAHFKEPRHVNNYRNLAYKYPKKRQLWLKIWFDKLEAAEQTNANYFEVMEEDEDDLEDEDDDVFQSRKYSASFSTTSSNWSDSSSIGSC